MRLGKRLKNKPWVQKTVGTLAAEYLRLVWTTSRFTMEPAEPYRLYEAQQPVIIAMWHGQHFLLPFLRRQYRFRVLISRHSDGEINAVAAERLGDRHGSRLRRSWRPGSTSKAASPDSRACWNRSSKAGTWRLTADVPKVSRVAGRGIIKLAQESGRPIFPVSLATSRRIVLDNWDRSEINLPFSRGGIVVGDPLRVPRDADTTIAATGPCDA